MQVRSVCLALAFALSGPSIALSEPYEEVHECDTYAAHPDDPNRWAKGVSDEDIIPGPAVKHCRDAVAEHPNTPRFLFQLGRAFWAANRLEEGTDAFLTLEEAFDYAPVYAYLGDAFYFGIGGVEPDPDLGVQLYEVAAAGGFGAAQEAINAIAGIADDEAAPPIAGDRTSDTASVVAVPAAAQQQVEETASVPAQIDFSSYNQPKVLQALSAGDIGWLKSSGMGSASVMGVSYSRLDIYLAGFNGEFSGTYNFKDPGCIEIYNPRVAKSLERRILSKATGGGTIEGSVATTMNMLMGTMQQMQSGGMLGMVDQQQQIELLSEEGAQDAAKLIRGYRCDDPHVQRIYANVAAFVLGTQPVVSAEERQRQAAEAARKAEAERKRAEAEAREAEVRRQAALRTDAREACVAQFKQAAFCGCVVGALDEAGVSESDWKVLQAEFKAVVGLKDAYPTVPAVLKECRSASGG